jgi:hypothetical protein
MHDLGFNGTRHNICRGALNRANTAPASNRPLLAAVSLFVQTHNPGLLFCFAVNAFEDFGG